jgi:hypothetical protein
LTAMYVQNVGVQVSKKIQGSHSSPNHFLVLEELSQPNLSGSKTTKDLHFNNLWEHSFEASFET